MAAMKNMMGKMADEGLQSYIATFDDAYGNGPFWKQFWAEDEAHAGEQCEDAVEVNCIHLIETQAEWEARTGTTLDYGRTENR